MRNDDERGRARELGRLPLSPPLFLSPRLLGRIESTRCYTLLALSYSAWGHRECHRQPPARAHG